MSVESAQQHPVSLYLKVWGWLFVLSFFSYMVDYLQFEGAARWGLILLFMVAKAGLILSIFMHVRWERLSLKLVLFLPMFAIAVFIILMAIEANYTETSRWLFFNNN
tara:strand:+ start:9061 stop:9381 length:321 start_codon:yes stop_codon:yes gene_type:complete